jgi:hypothetical protein
VFEAAGRGVAVHPGTQGVAQDRPVGAAVDGLIDSAGRRQGHEDSLAALPMDLQHSVAVFFTEVADGGAAGFEDP